jgi:TonB family protein
VALTVESSPTTLFVDLRPLPPPPPTPAARPAPSRVLTPATGSARTGPARPVEAPPPAPPAALPPPARAASVAPPAAPSPPVEVAVVASPRAAADAAPAEPAPRVEVAASPPPVVGGGSTAVAGRGAREGDRAGAPAEAPGGGGERPGAQGSAEGGGGASLAARSPAAGPGGAGAEYAGYLGLVRGSIQDVLEYPMSARRRGLTGTVVIEIDVDPGGAIGRVALVASSSHALLDDAVLRAARAAARTPFPPGLRPRPLRARLPIVFELQ